MATQILSAILHKEEDLYVAECPEVGTVSQGPTVEEAIISLAASGIVGGLRRSQARLFKRSGALLVKDDLQ